MKKTLLSFVAVLLLTLSCFARGGCGHCSAHCCHHGGGSGACQHYCSDTTNMCMIGVGLTNNGQVLFGRFLLHPITDYICIYYPSAQPQAHKNIHLKRVVRFVLAGSDTLLSYRKDSTEYCHIGHHKFMSRKLTNGKIEVYEKSDIRPSQTGIVSNEIFVTYYGLTVKVGSLKKLDLLMRKILPGYDEANPIGKKQKVNTTALFKAINDFNQNA